MLLLAVMLALGVSCAAYAASTETIKVVPESASDEEPDEEPDEDAPTIAYTIEEALEIADSETTDLIIDVSAFTTLTMGDTDDPEGTPGTITLDTETLDGWAFETITIQGSGSTVLKLAGSGVRHFLLNNSDITLGLRGVTLTGGGVYVEAGTLSADNVTFNANSASSNEDTSDQVGGAIHVASAGKLQLSTCTFTQNSAVSGGAIYSEGTRESTFTGLTIGGELTSAANHATNGGAVYIAGGAMTFTDTKFINNSADLNGGALYVSNGKLNLASGNTLDYNKAQNGGAIYLPDTENARMEFYGSSGMVLRGNTATTAGGAVYADEHSQMTFSVEVNFEDNHTNESSGLGGALWISSGKQLDGFSAKTSFSANTAAYGGAVYIGGTKKSAARFTSQGQFDFSDNTATYEGGAIYSVNADVTISGLDITIKNEAGEGGGFLKSGGTTTIQSSTISKQEAKFGGAIYSEGKMAIDNSVFSNNTATTDDGDDVGGGGAIFYVGTGTGNNISITSSDFTGNVSITNNIGQGGGALFISGDAVISDTTFSTNTHTNSANIDNGGGAIYLVGSLTLANAEFSSNRSREGGSRGGAIYSNGSSAINIDNCLFNNNQATNNGGAIIIMGQTATEITNSTFTGNNSSAAFGGAIYSYGTLTVQTSYFNLNRSAQSGGAIYFDQHNNANHPGIFTAESILFSENSAGIAPLTGQGGAVYLKPDAATINRCTFANNQSSAINTDSRGGAVYIDTNDTAVATITSVKNSVFFGNQVYGGSTNYGGAIYLTGQDISLVSDTFTGGNSAVERGGAVYVGSGTMTIAATIIVGNTADNGRDIYAEGTITSRGYNRIGVYGKGGNDTSWLADITTSTTDRENSAWTMTTFFGEDAGLVDNDGFVDAPEIGSSLGEGKVRLVAIPLKEADSLTVTDRATNIIPFARRFTLNIEQYDIWGIDRFTGNNDLSIGAHYLGGSGGGTGYADEGLYEIASISMSGIPNTLKSIGQTSSLVAIIHYINGRTAYGVPSDRTSVTQNQEERVTWSSSMPAFVKIDKSGNITALQMTNNTNGAIITVSTVRATPSGTKATDSRAVKVTGQHSYMNTISAAYQNYFSDYVQDIMEHDISISLTDVDRSTVLATGFQRNFSAAWNGAKAKAVTDLSVSAPSFSTATTYNNSQGLAASNGAAVNITFKDRSNGDLFPLTYSWNLSGAQVKALLGNDMSKYSINDSFAENLFKALRVDFQTATKNTTVIGSGGVKGSDARRYGALTLTKADGNAGLHVELTAYLANVATTGSGDGPQFVRGSGSKRLLVVPDGVNDGAITGTMWLAQSASTVVRKTPSSGSDSTSTTTGKDDGGTSSSGGGGGGGCASMSLGLLGVMVIFMKRR